MHLNLSTTSAVNSTYSNDSGQVCYKVDTPSTSIGDARRIIIRRAVETKDGIWLGEKEKDAHEELRNEHLIDFVLTRSSSPNFTLSGDTIVESGRHQGYLAHLAHIEYGTMNSSRILHAGNEMRGGELFKSTGWSWYGLGRHKVFRASDGCEYRWVINSKNPKLVSNDSSKSVIARFHRAKTGLLSSRVIRPASLEISPEGEHIIDEILITFVYLRDAEER